MGYTSFSENKVSSGLVFQYLLYVIINGREPRFMEVGCIEIEEFDSSLDFQLVVLFISRESLQLLEKLN